MALGRKLARVDRFGIYSLEEMAYRMVDELHASIQIAVNGGIPYVCVHNPAKDVIDERMPTGLAEMFKRKISEMRPGIRYANVTFGCYLWWEEGFWSGIGMEGTPS